MPGRGLQLFSAPVGLTHITVNRNTQEAVPVDFLKFMANPVGRGARILAGIALVVIGVLAVGHALGIALAVVGVVVFLAGAVNFCLFAPLAGGPFWGRRLQ
jgi:hypothetical protein